MTPLALIAAGLFWSLDLLTGAAAAQSPQRELDWVYLENETLRVGLLRSHGGAIGYLSARDSTRNLLNHHDHGRLVQQSYYGDEDGSRWGEQVWRYNPVQGGDYQGQAAQLLEFRATGTTAYARTRPRNWAGGQLLDECELEQWVELDGPLVCLRFAFRYRGERVHAEREQETPAMFVAPELHTLVSYSGAHPWTDAPLERCQPGWPNQALQLAEPWVAWVNDRDEGVGLYVPQTVSATCYRYRADGSSDCSYVAPLRKFALKPELCWTYTAWLTLGEAGQIRSRFKQLHSSLPSDSRESPDER